MEVVAKTKFVHQTPRKMRLVASQLRGMKVKEAVVLLENLHKRAAKLILLTLKQAIGNAVNNFQLAEDSLVIKEVEVGEGPRYKRMDKSHRFFRWGTIQKRFSHLKIVLEGEEGKKPKTSKPKKKGKKDGTKS